MFSCNLCDTNLLYCLFSANEVSSIQFSDNNSILIEKLLEEITENNEIDYTIPFLQCILYKLSKLNTDKKKSYASHIQSAIVYIMENFRTNITLKDTANYTKLAPAYLSSLFSKEIGTNFKVYLDNIRFDYAIKLLKFTTMSILEVCSKSGFSDYTNFTRRFKAKYGFTPLEYRKFYQI